MKKIIFTSTLLLTVLCFVGCNNKQNSEQSIMEQKVAEFAPVTLTTDMSQLSEKERQLVGLFIEAATIMDDLFWTQAFGDKSILDTISCSAVKDFVMINYGPWERLNNMKPFVSGYGEKPLGACFYPADMTKEEFDALKDPNKESLYTLVRRNAEGQLEVVWYKDAYKEQIAKVIELMKQAVELADDAGLKKYLVERIKAFETDDYLASDMAWMNMKNSSLDFVVGPIENYEDRLFGYKAAYEAFVLVKDKKWSDDLAKFTAMLPELQTQLPCDPKYKQEVPGIDSDLNVYDVVYYGGDCNAGSKTIAINLPNDERVHLEKGSRRLQLKNAMKAKFDHIVMPIANLMLDESQVQNVKFDAFFSNVTFHEVAHGLGIKNTVNGKGNLRQALKEQYSAWEEAKADILGLFMVEKLIEKGEITNCTVEEAYTTFIIGTLRSVRFGAASAHGKANMMCYNFFADHEVFTKNKNGKYVINMDKAKATLEKWSALVLQVEGEGDYTFAQQYCAEHSIIRAELQADLDKINSSGIPRDIRFNQGKKELGL